jgi:hypothetical protein
MLVDTETGRPFRAPSSFVLEKVDLLVEGLGGTPTSFEDWKQDLERRADEASIAPLRCELAYGTSLEEEAVRCPNLATQAVRVFKESDDLALMCDECAAQSWDISD